MMTEEEFAQKVQNEGGVLDALEYGLAPEDVEPGALRDAWEELCVHHGRMTPALYHTEGLIEDLAEPI